MIARGEKTIEEIEDMSDSMRSSYYQRLYCDAMKGEECFGCDVRYVQKTGNCRDGGKYYICRLGQQKLI